MTLGATGKFTAPLVRKSWILVCYTMHHTAKLEHRKGYARTRSVLGARAFRP